MANKQRYIDQAAVIRKRVRIERTKFLLDYFKTHPCTDCGEADPVVLEFDHLRDKSFDIGDHFAYVGWTKLLAEIAKCQVVCANCHRRRTSTRRGNLRAVLTAAAAEAGDGA